MATTQDLINEALAGERTETPTAPVPSSGALQEGRKRAQRVKRRFTGPEFDSEDRAELAGLGRLSDLAITMAHLDLLARYEPLAKACDLTPGDVKEFLALEGRLDGLEAVAVPIAAEVARWLKSLGPRIEKANQDLAPYRDGDKGQALGLAPEAIAKAFASARRLVQREQRSQEAQQGRQQRSQVRNAARLAGQRQRLLQKRSLQKLQRQARTTRDEDE
jgi:hypothetical protein